MVNSFFRFCQIKYVCINVAICDLVHNVEAVNLVHNVEAVNLVHNVEAAFQLC